jgi:hypothetical protein
MQGHEKILLLTLIKGPTVAVLALTLAAGAPGCVADTKRHADYFKPAKLETTYYHDPLESSDNDVKHEGTYLDIGFW